MQSTLDKLERSQGALLVAEDDDDDNEDDAAESKASDEQQQQQQVAGISLSAVGLDEEGPFVLDAGLIGELIREKTLSLTSGVVVLDFNHPAFHNKEFEVDLIRALSSVAKQLYEELGLLSVYVNVQPDDADS
eukprot:scaffold42202_cov233-Skeletonema_dohrnii-CCMP3373.AAC.1